MNLLRRRDNELLVREIDLLRQVIRQVRHRHPFKIDAWVVLPEHMHCVFTLPPDDCDFSLRWRLIKSGFSRALPKTETLSAERKKYGESGIWQRHYWEHLIRDEIDFQRHVDYVHVNPLKHGLAKRVRDWPYLIFPRNLVHHKPLPKPPVEAVFVAAASAACTRQEISNLS